MDVDEIAGRGCGDAALHDRSCTTNAYSYGLENQ